MSDRDVRRMLQRLARHGDKGSKGKARRGALRLFHPTVWIPAAIRVQAYHYSQSFQTYRTPLLDLSSTGAGLIFGRFVHEGIDIKIALVDLHGRVHVIEGVSAWCRHHARNLHRVGMAFYDSIELPKFSSDVPTWWNTAEMASDEATAELALMVEEANADLRDTNAAHDPEENSREQAA